jgi:hypothetical protein
MKIDYRGRVYEFDFATLTVEECEEIEKFTGARGLGDWSNLLTAANTKALQAAWWAMRRHAGEDPGPVSRRDPSLLPLALNEALVAAEKAELEAQLAAAAEEAEADPTSPAAPSSPGPADTTTTRAAAGSGPSLPG